MGLDTAIRNDVLKSACPDAFHEQGSPMARENGVEVMDIMTDIHAAYNPARSSRSFTGIELYQWLKRILTTAVRHGSRTLIVCIDDANRVPSEKVREQSRRDTERREEPLPDGTVFGDHGCQLTPGAPPVPFDIGQALGNRGLRPALFKYLIDAIQRFWMDDSVSVVIDHYESGAVVYQNGKWGSDYTARHPWGEADMMVAYWVNRLWRGEPRNFYVRSTDSDMIAILLGVLAHADPKDKQRQLWVRYWRDNRKQKTRWVNMRRIHKYVTRELGWSTYAFVVYCCLCGTDFTDPKRLDPEKPNALPRRQLFRGISPRRVMEAFVRFGVVDRLRNNGPDTPVSMQSFGYAVRAVYTRVLTATELGMRSVCDLPKDLRQDMQARLDDKEEQAGHATAFKLRFMRKLQNYERFYLPSDEELVDIHKDLNWNLVYWLQDWDKVFAEGKTEAGLVHSKGTVRDGGLMAHIPKLFGKKAWKPVGPQAPAMPSPEPEPEPEEVEEKKDPTYTPPEDEDEGPQLILSTALEDPREPDTRRGSRRRERSLSPVARRPQPASPASAPSVST